jgi:hypothetical protein
LTRSAPLDWVSALERADPEERCTLLAFVAGRAVSLDEEELNAALRRAELLLATGGDPRRRLELYGRAVSALAADLDGPTPRAELGEGLAALGPEVEPRGKAAEGLRLLRADPDLAWQCFACALLAEELARED